MLQALAARQDTDAGAAGIAGHLEVERGVADHHRFASADPQLVDPAGGDFHAQAPGAAGYGAYAP